MVGAVNSSTVGFISSFASSKIGGGGGKRGGGETGREARRGGRDAFAVGPWDVLSDWEGLMGLLHQFTSRHLQIKFTYSIGAFSVVTQLLGPA